MIDLIHRMLIEVVDWVDTTRYAGTRTLGLVGIALYKIKEYWPTRLTEVDHCPD